MKKIAELTEAHLDRAMDGGWTSTTCLIAQCALEHLADGSNLTFCSGKTVKFSDGRKYEFDEQAQELQTKFDNAAVFTNIALRHEWKLDEIAVIRSMLPIDIVFTQDPMNETVAVGL